MIRKYSLLLFTILFVTISHVSIAQEETKLPSIEEKDIELFIKTYKSVEKDLEGLGYDLTENQSLEALMADQKAKSILDKHGWNTSFQEKVGTIALGYSYLKINEEAEKLGKDENLAKGMMIAMIEKLGEQLDPKDIKALKAKYSDLDAFFTELEAEQK